MIFQPRTWSLRATAAVTITVTGCLIGSTHLAVAANTASKVFATVQVQRVSRALQAYGQIEPIAVLRVRAVDSGTLSDLDVVPGSVVAAGTALARIGGPRMQSLLIVREQALRSAMAREDMANRALQIARRQFKAQLSTLQEVDAAQSEMAATRAATQTARARLREIRSLQTVRAPTAGTILAVQAANGEEIASGQPIVTLQPTGSLWLRAAYYGKDIALLHVGMAGRFQPSEGGDAVSVKIVAISSAIAADGGVHIGLIPTTAAIPQWWINGQWGKLTLMGPMSQMVIVPTQALILDRGHWWILLHSPAGNKPQPVVPGPTRGWQTAIVSGLKPGQQVIVTGAFLDYHRGIARTYTPPN